ncbi:hypothetical protein ABT297_21995 [Dactylosporangium sp. NPDC000555]|uniref:hypothetical protein n=1 Tax=Dactylosporangium sp. NPDC000555 TaxID=3154260 RepID=UPI00332E2B75
MNVGIVDIGIEFVARSSLEIRTTGRVGRVGDIRAAEQIGPVRRTGPNQAVLCARSVLLAGTVLGG